MADLLGDRVKLMMDSTASALNAIRDGRIKALAVTTGRRAPAPLDTIPSIGETIPGFDAAGWSRPRRTGADADRDRRQDQPRRSGVAAGPGGDPPDRGARRHPGAWDTG